VSMFEHALGFANALSPHRRDNLFSRLDRVRTISHNFGYGVGEDMGFPSFEVHPELALIVLESLVAFVPVFRDRTGWIHSQASRIRSDKSRSWANPTGSGTDLLHR
jgi:hypothetical protein